MKARNLFIFFIILGTMAIIAGVYVGLLKDERSVPTTALTAATTNEVIPPSVVVFGTDKWTDSGIKVKAGQQINITASGSVVWDQDLPAVDPNGSIPASELPRSTDFPIPAARCGSLVMRIGNKKYPVGSGNKLTAQTDGKIEFMVNDRYDYLFNNSGSFNVFVEVK